jgi:hypothetical protein
MYAITRAYTNRTHLRPLYGVDKKVSDLVHIFVPCETKLIQLKTLAITNTADGRKQRIPWAEFELARISGVDLHCHLLQLRCSH